MKQLELFPKPAKYAKKPTHKPNPYVVLGTWGLAHLAKSAITQRPQLQKCGVEGRRSETSDHRERQNSTKPTFSSRWLDPESNGE